MSESINATRARRAGLVGCPRCGVPAGVSCVTMTTRPTARLIRDRTVPHVGRFRAWRGKRQALAAALALADATGLTTRPEPNTDYRMRSHTAERVYDEGRVRILKIGVLLEPGGGFGFHFSPLDRPQSETAEGLTANFEAVGGPWARTFEKLERP